MQNTIPLSLKLLLKRLREVGVTTSMGQGGGSNGLGYIDWGSIFGGSNQYYGYPAGFGGIGDGGGGGGGGGVDTSGDSTIIEGLPTLDRIGLGGG